MKEEGETIASFFLEGANKFECNVITVRGQQALAIETSIVWQGNCIVVSIVTAFSTYSPPLFLEKTLYCMCRYLMYEGTYKGIEPP